MSGRRRPWGTYGLGAVVAGAVVAAVLVVGPPSASPSAGGRAVTAARGVVQQTVSGSGSIAAARQLNVNFANAGKLTHVYVKPGQHVVEGQLLGEIDSHDAQLALDEATANLTTLEAGGSSGSGSGGSGSGSGASAASGTTAGAAAAASVAGAGAIAVAPATPTTATTPTPATTTPTTPTTTTPRPSTTPTSATPAPATRPSTTPAPAATSAPATAQGRTAGGGSGGSGSGSSGSGAAKSSAPTAAQLASAEAAVESAQATLDATKLTAPSSGTVAAVNAQAGEQVSGGGVTNGAGSGSSGSSSGSGGSGGAGSAGSSGAGGSSGSTFVVLADLDTLDLVVPFSESDVGKVKVGQPATVSVNALPNQQLAAHVTSIATLPTSSSGVVSYDVTFRLDQRAPGLRAGMTATAQVVVARATGAVNVPSSAISRRGGAPAVTVVQNGKQVQRQVVTGLVGDSTTQVLSGLRAGDQVWIATPTLGSGGSGAGATASGLGTRVGGGAGGLGGGGGGLGGGGRVIFGGGGP